jgi:hypothetical protein
MGDLARRTVAGRLSDRRVRGSQRADNEPPKKGNLEMMTQRHVSQLQKIVGQLQKILDEAAAQAAGSTMGKSSGTGKRTKRSAAEVKRMRKEIASARKRGASVAELAEEYGVTTSYIYQL